RAEANGAEFGFEGGVIEGGDLDRARELEPPLLFDVGGARGDGLVEGIGRRHGCHRSGDRRGRGGGGLRCHRDPGHDRRGGGGRGRRRRRGGGGRRLRDVDSAGLLGRAVGLEDLGQAVAGVVEAVGG